MIFQTPGASTMSAVISILYGAPYASISMKFSLSSRLLKELDEITESNNDGTTEIKYDQHPMFLIH